MGFKVKFEGLPEFSSGASNWYDAIKEAAKEYNLNARYTMKGLVKASKVNKVNPKKRGPKKKKKDMYSSENAGDF